MSQATAPKSTPMLNGQSLDKEIQFIREIMIEMLQKVDREVCDFFLSLNSKLQANTNTTKDQSNFQAIREELHIINRAGKTLEIIKAFSLYNILINIVEERFNIDRKNPLDRIQNAYDDLLHRGFDKQDLDKILESICFYPVFTAHPTESRRRTFLEAHSEITQDLRKIFELGDTKAKDHIQYRLHLLWQTNLVRTQKIEVLFELDNLLFIVENSILPSSQKVLEYIETMLNHPLKRSPIQLGSWIGGDRDGNPFVTNDVMIEVMKIQHKLIINFYIKKLKRLVRELSIANDCVQLSPLLSKSLHKDTPILDEKTAQGCASEPIRAKLYIMIKKLQNRLVYVNAPSTITHTYTSPQELIADTDMLVESLDSVSSTYLRQFRRFVLLGGFHLMRLDFREHKDVFAQALSEILCLLGVCDNDFMSYKEERKIEVLNTALARPKLELGTIQEQLSESAQNVIEIFMRIVWGKKYINENILKTFILSMTTDASDLLCVLWFAKQTGLWKPSKKLDSRAESSSIREEDKLRARIAITPLFETIDDLNRAGGIMRTLVANPHYSHYLHDIGMRQEIMVGYSDSSKDGGIFASNYSLYGAIQELKALEGELGVEFVLFHGRGGSVSRGGGTLESALLASPPRSVQGFLKTTEQGEVISSKYLNSSSAQFFLSSTMAALLKKTSYDVFCAQEIATMPTNIAAKCSINPHHKQLMEELSHISYKTYRKLVYETQGFIDYFKAATPLAFIQQLNLGSRPSKRKDTTKVEDLRAIPWVFAWTQNRSIIPAWYGLGSALSAVDLSALQECYAESEFFAATISNISQAFLKVDLCIAKQYNDFVQDPAIAQSIWSQITQEYDKTAQMLLAIRQESNLLDNEPTLQKSILLRNDSVMTLNLLQIELIKQYLSTPYEAKRARLMEQIHSTIIGIAQGLRNTG